MKTKVIIFGVNGYIGSHLAQYLLNKGAEVLGYDIAEQPLLAEIEYQKADLTSADAWKKISLNCDTIYYCTGLTGTAISFERYGQFNSVNELSILHLLDRLRQCSKQPRVIFPSSRLVYRGGKLPLPENAPKEAKTIYAANKIAAEHLLYAYHNAYGISYTIARLCVPYGNKLGTAYSYGTLGAFMRQIREKGVITLFGDGQLRRTFSYIEDLCFQLTELAIRSDAIAQTYNTDGDDLSLVEVATLIAECYGGKIQFTEFPDFANRIESGDTVFDATKIRNLFGDEPTCKMSLKKWIRQMKENSL